MKLVFARASIGHISVFLSDTDGNRTAIGLISDTCCSTNITFHAIDKVITLDYATHKGGFLTNGVTDANKRDAILKGVEKDQYSDIIEQIFRTVIFSNSIYNGLKSKTSNPALSISKAEIDNGSYIGKLNSIKLL